MPLEEGAQHAEQGGDRAEEGEEDEIYLDDEEAYPLLDVSRGSLDRARWRGGSFHQVVSLPYRPPELLFGDRTHGKMVDVWSLGILALELVKASVLGTLADCLPPHSPSSSISRSPLDGDRVESFGAIRHHTPREGDAQHTTSSVATAAAAAAVIAGASFQAPAPLRLPSWEDLLLSSRQEAARHNKEHPPVRASSCSGPLLPSPFSLVLGTSEIDALSTLTSLLGSIRPTQMWPAITGAPGYFQFPHTYCPYCSSSATATAAARAHFPPTAGERTSAVPSSSTFSSSLDLSFSGVRTTCLFRRSPWIIRKN